MSEIIKKYNRVAELQTHRLFFWPSGNYISRLTLLPGVLHHDEENTIGIELAYRMSPYGVKAETVSYNLWQKQIHVLDGWCVDPSDYVLELRKMGFYVLETAVKQAGRLADDTTIILTATVQVNSWGFMQ